MVERVLLATDGSDAADAVVEEGVRIAAALEAELHVLHVVDTRTPMMAPEAMAVDWAEVIAGSEKRGRSAVDRALGTARAAGLEAEGAVVRADRIHQAILDHAHEIEATLLVLGTHGRSGLSRMLLGSVAERVLRMSDLPVVVVPEREGG